ncbi:hypothetical protein M885DRAFT_563890 [Pelagophyceae sp. CCMP2097]|nr:hypothetical protein M885DRAFT_563890 [Pelagophyceae sp. CCMP2097]
MSIVTEMSRKWKLETRDAGFDKFLEVKKVPGPVAFVVKNLVGSVISFKIDGTTLVKTEHGMLTDHVKPALTLDGVTATADTTPEGKAGMLTGVVNGEHLVITVKVGDVVDVTTDHYVENDKLFVKITDVASGVAFVETYKQV